MSDRAAPRVFVSYSHDSPEHKEQVRLFATFLRERVGLDARLDQWYDNTRRDWALWAGEHMSKADFVLVIASPAYKRRAEGSAPPNEGNGSQYEAAMIRDLLTKNLRHGIERVLPVVLPGQSMHDIPAFLNPHSTTRFHIEEFTQEGVSDLLAAITGQGQHPMPELGEWRATPTADAERQQVMSVSAMAWTASSSDVRAGRAQIDGVPYHDSIVLQPLSFPAESQGFVEAKLDGGYRWMTSVAGVLDDATEPFQVGVFRVFVDGSPRWEGRAAFGKPAPIKVNVRGATRLRLEMYRIGPANSPLRPRVPRTGRLANRLPELAWGNPILF
jgi:hypothetical protein